MAGQLKGGREVWNMCLISVFRWVVHLAIWKPHIGRLNKTLLEKVQSSSKARILGQEREKREKREARRRRKEEEGRGKRGEKP